MSAQFSTFIPNIDNFDKNKNVKTIRRKGARTLYKLNS